jgi:hypothetical protein
VSSIANPDRLIEVLASLPAVAPDVSHADAIRARCRLALESREADPFAALEPAAGVACAAYAVQLVRLALLLTP